MKLAITGVMGSGKTTVANYLIEKYNFKKFSFADDVKKYAYEIFNMKHKDRKLLQEFASKLREIDNYIWIKKLDEKLKNNNHINIIIDDLRFPEEYEYLKSNDFLILKLDIHKDLQIKRLKDTYPNDFQSHINSSHHNSETHYFDYHNYNSNDIYTYIDMIINKNN
jgi:adenylate kinase family enzyme